MGKETASVFYIGAVPSCTMNDVYMARQLESLRTGHAPPDYRTDEDDDGEAQFKGFLGFTSLKTEPGRQAMAMPVMDVSSP